MLWCEALWADVKLNFPQQVAETEATIGENVKSHGPVLWDRYIDIHVDALKKCEGRCYVITLINVIFFHVRISKFSCSRGKIGMIEETIFS